MMKRFILPELWYVEGDTNNIKAKDAWNDLYKDLGQSYKFAFFENCFYYLNTSNIKSHTKKQPPEGYTKITCEEFLKYVINKEDPFTQTEEYNEILIKLLKDE